MADSRMIRNQYDYLRRLDVDELERLLQLAVNPQSDEEDSDYVDALLEVILEKEEENNTGRLSDVDEKWQEFQHHYNTEDGKDQRMYYTEEENKPNQVQAPTLNVTTLPKRRPRRIMMVAAIIVILVSMTLVPVMGHKNVIQLFAQWTGEQFSFVKFGNTQIIPEEYADLFIALHDFGIEDDEITVPQIIPEGFTLVEKKLYSSPKTGDISFLVTYQKIEEYIVFQLEQIESNTNKIAEKDPTEVTIYKINGIDHFFLNNNSNITVVWYIGTVKYALSSSLPLDDIISIINSMY